jgi:predicted TIM-barrel fold metal-dependent hydrolase
MTVQPAGGASTRGVAATLGLVDHHCHGVVPGELDRPSFERLATESDWPLPPGCSAFDTPLGVSVRARCAPLLDLSRHASGEEYLDRRATLGSREVTRRLLAASGIDLFLIDTGFHGSDLLGPEAMSAATGAAAREVVRLEALGEQVARESTAARFGPAFVEALQERSRRCVAAKSILAYRYGLDVDPTRPSPGEVAEAAGRWLTAADRGGPRRLDHPVLLRHLLWTAVELRLAIQVHVGYGDPDITLHRCDPSQLTEFLRLTRDSGARIMLLHCYPFIREAGILAQLFPHVFLDTSSAVSHSGAGSLALIRESLEVAPFSKLLFASDAYGLPELYLCGTAGWRDGISRVLDEWLAADLIGAADAERYVRMIGRDNALRAYGLELQEDGR